MIEIIPNWHPYLVHFTIALLTVSVITIVVSALAKDIDRRRQLLTFGLWNLWLGVAISLLTAGAGIYAYNTVDHDTPSHAAMTDHRNWALITLAVFISLAIWSRMSASLRTKASPVFLLAAVIGLLSLMTTGYKGAETVYRHGIGVMSLPKSEGEGHAHEHGESHAHDEKPVDTLKAEPTMEKPATSNVTKKEHHDDGHDHTH